MKLIFFVFVTLSILSAPATAQNVHLDKKVKVALNNVSKERIKSDITYLADDKLIGRMPGEKGFQMAVDYIVDQYKQIGLVPAGDNGSYLQKLVLRKTTLNNSLSNAVLTDRDGNEDSLSVGKDIF